jgi:hypothetical protein
MPNYKGPTTPTIDSEYTIGRNEAINKANPNSDTYVARTMQQHHDYYVQKFLDAQKAGVQLDEKNMEEYRIAIIREQRGIVNP